MRITFFFISILVSLVTHAQLAEPFQDANGKWGYKYKDGKADVAPVYDIAMPYNSAGFAEVNIGRQYKLVNGKKILLSPGKWGVLHYYRGLVIKPQYDGIMSQISDYFSFNIGAIANEEGFITGGKWGLINCDKNSILIQPQYDFVFDFSEGLALIRKPDSQKGFNGIVSFIDKTGKTVFDLPNAKFSDKTIFRNGFAMVENKDGSFNLIDKSGKLVKE